MIVKQGDSKLVVDQAVAAEEAIRKAEAVQAAQSAAQAAVKAGKTKSEIVEAAFGAAWGCKVRRNVADEIAAEVSDLLGMTK